MILFHDLKFRELSCLLRPIVVCFFLQVSCSIAFVCKQWCNKRITPKKWHDEARVPWSMCACCLIRSTYPVRCL
jgi:hypothetical protein